MKTLWACAVLAVVGLGAWHPARADECEKRGMVEIQDADVDKIREAILNFCDPHEHRTFCKVRDVKLEAANGKTYQYSVECKGSIFH